MNDNVVSGVSKYVTGYTQFSSKTSEQQGNYIALKVVDVSPEAVVKYNKVGSSKSVTLDADRNIVLIVNDPNAVLRFTVTEDGETTTKDIKLTNLVLEPAPTEAE